MSKYRIPRTQEPSPVAAPARTSYAPLVVGLSGWGVALLLLVALAMRGGCSLPWPSIVKTGPRGVVILRESSKDTPAFGAAIVKLQGGDPEIAAYKKEKGHKFSILDYQSKDANEQLAVKRWVDLIGKLDEGDRWLFIYDLKSREVLAKQKLPSDVTTEVILAALKAKGG